MKIGLVCPYNFARGGGVQEIVRALQAELGARGHETKILTPQPREAGEYYDNEGVIFIGQAADFRSPLHTTAQFSVTGDIYGVEQMLEEEQFDVLHFHEPWVPMLSKQILSRSRSVNIATFHAKIPETLMSRTVARVVTPYTKSVLKYLHELTAVSEAAAEYICSLTDAPVTIIPNGIDLSVYKHAKRLDGSLSGRTILYIGRLEKRKGVACLLEAYQLLVARQPDVRLLLAGDGPDRAKLEELVQDKELTGVTFLGHVSEEEKIALLASADLFCSPALYGESFGIVLLEAMASGLVTVAANNAGYSDVLQGLGSLSLVNPKEPEEFARRLDVMLNDVGLRLLWQKWAKQYVKQFSYPRVVDQYLEVYELSHKRHSPVVSL